MPILLLILLIGVFTCAWFSRRTPTLRRACRWRLDRGTGPNHYRCAACGATTATDGGDPRDCLNPRQPKLKTTNQPP